MMKTMNVDVEITNNITNNEDLVKLLNLHFNKTHLDMKDYAIKNDVPIIQDEGLAFLESIIKIKRPLKILEIGSAIGYSSTRMALASNAVVHTIERDPVMYEKAKYYINELNLNNRVHIYLHDALEAYDLVKSNKFDLIFIDAAKAQYKNFFTIYENLLTEDGMIVSDNMFFHGLTSKDAVIKDRNLKQLVRKINTYHEFILNHENYDTSIFDIGDGMAVTTKKLKYIHL
ncbi:MAG: O-methyltransferase [Anaeroplasmataceae bacterium]